MLDQIKVFLEKEQQLLDSLSELNEVVSEIIDSNSNDTDKSGVIYQGLLTTVEEISHDVEPKDSAYFSLIDKVEITNSINGYNSSKVAELKESSLEPTEIRKEISDISFMSSSILLHTLGFPRTED